MATLEQIQRGAAYRASSFSRGAEATEELASRLARSLRGGSRLLLSGELGAGKTCFARGFARGLGIETGVQSPSFVLEMRHPAGKRGLRFFHYDAYRLSGEEEWYALGFDEGPEPDTISLIEWPERLENALRREDILILFHGGEAFGERELELFIPPDISEEEAMKLLSVWKGGEAEYENPLA